MVRRRMKIVIPGGSGQVGTIFARAFCARGDEVVVLSRRANGDGDGDSGARPWRLRHWDGKTLGPWASEIDGADVVINLAGRTVNCRYTEENLRQMIDSRVDSTRVVGEAIAAAERPPPLWLQMSTATIYAHRYDAANDEARGIIGGSEVGVPAYWARSVDIAKAWESTLDAAQTPETRKVALRTAMVMSPDADGVFSVLAKLVRLGFGGPVDGGTQYVSWIHERDLVAAIDFLIAHSELAGPVNVCAPTPLTQRAFMADLRAAMGRRLGLPATKWMLGIGAFFMRTDTELLLKSRRVVPGRLLEAGFGFEYETWGEAARELVARSRAQAAV